MRERLLRGTVLTYALTICLAVWPFSATPILGKAQQAAEDLLMSASLRPGMAVFPGFEDQGLTAWAACTEVHGRRNRKWEALFVPECPRQGLLFLESPFEDTVHRMLTTPKLPLLRPQIVRGPGAPEVVRNLLQLSDYFCHLQPELERIALRWEQTLRSFESGQFRPPENELVCIAHCAELAERAPRCALRPIASKRWEF